LNRTDFGIKVIRLATGNDRQGAVASRLRNSLKERFSVGGVGLDFGGTFRLLDVQLCSHKPQWSVPMEQCRESRIAGSLERFQ